ncbi:MAG: (d)CMP kinase [Pseudomonadota bacterium]
MKVVTIDGPAASGKSSVSRELANRMGWSWVSTGAFYRGLAFVAQKTGTHVEDEAALVALASSKVWRVEKAIENTKVIFEEEDVTEHIYKEEVGAAASKLSSLAGVRKSLLEAQRQMASDDSWLIAEGRDCGTVVFPEAPLKVYLTARSEARAQRRASEQGVSLEETQKSQAERDRQDATRKAAPMQVPESAHVIDTSTLNLEQVVDEVQKLAKNSLGSI